MNTRRGEPEKPVLRRRRGRTATGAARSREMLQANPLPPSRRELAAISRAAGVVMYVIANSNVLNIGGGCNVEQI